MLTKNALHTVAFVMFFLAVFTASSNSAVTGSDAVYQSVSYSDGHGPHLVIGGGLYFGTPLWDNRKPRRHNEYGEHHYRHLERHGWYQREHHGREYHGRHGRGHNGHRGRM